MPVVDFNVKLEDCNYQQVVINLAKKETLNLVYQVNKTFDGKILVQDPAGLETQLDMAQKGIITSSFPEKCPLKEFAITKILDANGQIVNQTEFQ